MKDDAKKKRYNFIPYYLEAGASVTSFFFESSGVPFTIYLKLSAGVSPKLLLQLKILMI